MLLAAASEEAASEATSDAASEEAASEETSDSTSEEAASEDAASEEAATEEAASEEEAAVEEAAELPQATMLTASAQTTAILTNFFIIYDPFNIQEFCQGRSTLPLAKTYYTQKFRFCKCKLLKNLGKICEKCELRKNFFCFDCKKKPHMVLFF